MNKAAWLVLVALVLTGWAWSQDNWFVPTDPIQAELEGDHNVISQFVTPHTAWGSPWAMGPARVLFFVNGRGTAAREVVELRQRFDIDPAMIFWGRIIDSARDDWHGAEMGTQRIDRLLAEKWDAFVFLGVKLEYLSYEQQYSLLNAVVNGAGLVMSGVDDKRVLKDTNRLDPVPGTLASGTVGETFRLREGRGLRLPGQPSIQYAPGWEVAYDYWAQRLGRGILWAAGKEPRVGLTLEQPAEEVDRADLPGHHITVRWQAPADCEGLALEVTLRRGDGWKTALPGIDAPALEGQAKVQVPLVRADRYFVDVIARSARGVENFGSVAFSVTSPRRVEKVTLDQAWAEVGGQFVGKAELAGEARSGDERLVVSLLDRRGRELKRQVAEAEGSFRFAVDSWLPMLVTVRATLIEGTQEISSAWSFANVTKRNRGRFNFLMWDVPHGALAPYAEESLARTGVTLQLGGGAPPPYLAAHDVAWVPYTTDISAKKDEQGVMMPMCWNDEERIQAHVDAIVEKHVGISHHGVFAYSLGDEIAVRGSCLSPHCLAAYQRYLKEQYGQIQALNDSWGTQFPSFEEVQLSKADGDAENEAFRAGNFPRWFDRQAYQSYNFCTLCERFGEGFRKTDPEAICGFEGAGRFQDGDDLDGFVRSNTFWSPYPGTADEVLRSIAPRDFPRSNWMGYTKDADTLLLQYWRMVTRGCDSVWWWRWEVIGRFHGWLSPTLDPYPAVAEIIEDTRVVREGLGDLLLKCEMLDDGVGMMFSQPSAYAAKVQHSPTYGSYQGEHAAWHGAIRELGLNFRYFTDRQLRLGEAGLERFRVIILPQTQALSAQETGLLREYVRGGGVLVADVRPGIYDGHVKPLASGALDDVFGVKRVRFADATVASAEISGTLGERNLGMTAPQAKVDSGIEAAGATALGRAGETPVFLVNSFGRGQAVLLNLSLGSVPGLALDTTPEAVAEALQAVFELARVRPAVRLFNAAGQRLRNVEVTRWRNGETELISVFRQRGEAEAARLTLNDERRLYDLKRHRDLGKQVTHDLRITPYRALVFAATSEPAEPAVVTVDRATVAQGDVVRATVAFPGAKGLRAARLRTMQPDGQTAEWLEQTVVADAEGVSVDLPVAYNDPTGQWTVSATELHSNDRAVCRFTVNPGDRP